MWPSDGLFDKTVQPPICSSSLHNVCVRERRRDRQRARDVVFLRVSETERHTPLVRDRLKAREKRLCLDREKTSSITSSTAWKSTFKQRVNGEFLKLGWDSCGSRSSYGANRLFSHKVTMLLVYISRQQRYLASSCWLNVDWTVVEGVWSSYVYRLFAFVFP